MLNDPNNKYIVTIQHYYFFVAGCWSLVTGHWLLVTGRWSLVTGRWSLVAITRNQKPETRNQKPETRNQKPINPTPCRPTREQTKILHVLTSRVPFQKS